MPDARPVPDDAVAEALIALWAASGWRRLEISRWPGSPGYGGYCLPPAAPRPRRRLLRSLRARPAVLTADALQAPGCPAVITRLARLLEASGWQRLEITGRPRLGRLPSGRCVRADGSGVSLTEALRCRRG